MSDRALGIAQVEQHSVTPMPAGILRRTYTPLATLLLVLLLGLWLVYEAEPLVSTPPEQRKEVGVSPALSPGEAAMARAVIEPGFASRGGREQLLFIGNSQTMAIPYAQPWDISTPQWFQVLLSRRAPEAVDVHRGSLGGMTWPEVVVRVVDFEEGAPAPAAVIINLRPEMLSDLAVRNEVRGEARQPVVAAALETMVGSNPNLPNAAHIIDDLEHADGANRVASIDDAPWPIRLENAFQSGADRLQIFAQRDLFIEMANITFRRFRNRLFGVNSASVRPLEGSIYRTNLELLEEMLQYSQQKGVQTVIYLGPLRSIQPNPNPSTRVARIRHDVAEITQRHNVVLLDYTTLVAEGFWSDYEPSRLNELTGDAGQHDFAHFREAAHRLIAEKLVQDAGAKLLRPLPTR